MEVRVFHSKVDEFLPGVRICIKLTSDLQLEGSLRTRGSILKIDAVGDGVVSATPCREPEGRVDQVSRPLRVGVVLFTYLLLIVVHLQPLRQFCRGATAFHGKGITLMLGLFGWSAIFRIIARVANVVLIPVIAASTLTTSSGLSSSP